MTLEEMVVRWVGSWRYDKWFREKYRLPFNSESHRQANQIDIKFEYVESKLAEREIRRYNLEKQREKDIEEKHEDELFDNMKLQEQ